MKKISIFLEEGITSIKMSVSPLVCPSVTNQFFRFHEKHKKVEHSIFLMNYISLIYTGQTLTRAHMSTAIHEKELRLGQIATINGKEID